MKKIILSSLLLASTTFLVAQKNTVSNNNISIEQQVLLTQNDLGTFKKVEKANNAQGYNYEYFKGKELQLVQIRSVEPTVEKYVSWYFSNGKMIYSETQWIAPTGDMVFSDKYYLSNDKLIRWVKDGKEIASTEQAFKDAEAKLVPYGKKIAQQASE